MAELTSWLSMGMIRSPRLRSPSSKVCLWDFNDAASTEPHLRLRILVEIFIVLERWFWGRQVVMELSSEVQMLNIFSSFSAGDFERWTSRSFSGEASEGLKWRGWRWSVKLHVFFWGKALFFQWNVGPGGALKSAEISGGTLLALSTENGGSGKLYCSETSNWIATLQGANLEREPSLVNLRLALFPEFSWILHITH